MPAKKTTKTSPDLDVAAHILVPKHEKVSQKEKDELLKQYHATIKQMPRILITDAALKDLDVEEGDLIRIRRTSPTAGDTVFYRVVITE